jgi:hypothetical protein
LTSSSPIIFWLSSSCVEACVQAHAAQLRRVA